MDQYFSTADIDSGLVDKIVCEVKSQGLFDQFRRECLADVDTKPAYQNLQHRVESSVSSFLQDQKWTPQLNKNQLREKLRKFITEKGFLEAGVERIVDQVVNPKLNTNFVPKIEDVAYKFMGVEKPVANVKAEIIDEETTLPNLDLEQVSPESEKSPSIESKSPILLYDSIQNNHNEDDKMDDLESPAFEPIGPSEFLVKQEKKEMQDDDMDICSEEDNDGPIQMNGASVTNYNDEVKSNISSISGLTSNDSNNECTNGDAVEQIKTEEITVKIENIESENLPSNNAVYEEKLPMFIENCVAPEITADTADKLPQSENIISNTSDLLDNMNQDSVLSQVSSNSRLSIVTNNNTNTRMDDADGDTNNIDIVPISNGDGIVKTNIRDICPYGISEEAQMQKFNESSSSNNSLVIDTDNVSNGTNQFENSDEQINNFDIKKEEIKFEGTERKSFDIDINDVRSTIEMADTLSGEVYPKVSIDEIKMKDDSIKMELESLSKTENSKDVQIKADDVDSISCENINTNNSKSDLPVFKSTSNEAKSPNTMDADDLKHAEDSNSSNSKQKYKHESKLSSNRNGNESDSKNRSKDRHHSSSSSSKDRHRSHSERDKDKRPHSSYHSSYKDKTKTSRDETDSKDASSKHRENSSSTSKNKHDDRSKSSHHKSSTSKSNDSSRSSTKKERDQNRDRDKSKTDKNSSTSSGNGRKEYSRHSSSSGNQKDKQDSKHLDKRRSDAQKSSSKQDDHSIYKDKSVPRQRSRSKDSNDGSAYSSIGSQSTLSSTETNSASQSSPSNNNNNNNNDPSSGKGSTEHQKTTSHSNSMLITDLIDNADEYNHQFSPNFETKMEMGNVVLRCSESGTISMCHDDDFVLTSQPVVVDQILTGNEINLELFIGENRNDPLVSSIEQSLYEPKVKKPKVAANIYEARKLMKVRKEIDRNEQKKLEQARVLAKQYIRTNASTVRDDSQGVELEFVCMESSNGSKTTGPTISSPVKFANDKEMIEEKRSIPTATVTSASLSEAEPIKKTIEFDASVTTIEEDIKMLECEQNESGDSDFLGFTVEEAESAKFRSQIFNEIVKKQPKKSSPKIKSKPVKKIINPIIQMGLDADPKHRQLFDMLTNDNQQLFFENNKLGDSIAAHKPFNCKRKNTETSVTHELLDASKLADNEESDLILASVFISQTSSSCNAKANHTNRSDAVSALEKQRQKTRYSNDDLFKPRPVLGGISRSRRRGFNCND